MYKKIIEPIEISTKWILKRSKFTPAVRNIHFPSKHTMEFLYCMYATYQKVFSFVVALIEYLGLAMILVMTSDYFRAAPTWVYSIRDDSYSNADYDDDDGDDNDVD